MTTAGQRVVGLRLIWGDPYSPMLTMHWYICLLTLFLKCYEKIVQDTPDPRNPCERAGWRSFRGKGPDEAKEQDSRMIEETSA
jgi:hypothetical protein